MQESLFDVLDRIQADLGTIRQLLSPLIVTLMPPRRRAAYGSRRPQVQHRPEPAARKKPRVSAVMRAHGRKMVPYMRSMIGLSVGDRSKVKELFRTVGVRKAIRLAKDLKKAARAAA